MGRAVQRAERKRREREEPGEGEESRKEQDSEEPKGLCYIGKTSWGKGRNSAAGKVWVGVLGWVRNSERNQDSVTGTCYAERSLWPVSALIC